MGDETKIFSPKAFSNKNYTVDYTNTSYCGFCGVELNNNTGICENCRNLRAKLGEWFIINRGLIFSIVQTLR